MKKKNPRILVWFSCGVVSAVAAFEAIKKYGHKNLRVLLCDTRNDESQDNYRFTTDIEKWLDHKIEPLKSRDYNDRWEVFDDRKYLRDFRGGAPCTVELKKRRRWEIEQPGDIQIMGFAGDEFHRVVRFRKDNPDVNLEWILEGTTKTRCGQIIEEAGIELPELYRQGYPNNNCIGCVKAESIPYWQHIRQDYPTIFKKMADYERRLGFALNRKRVDGKKVPVFLDELPAGLGKIRGLKVECGVACGMETQTKMRF